MNVVFQWDAEDDADGNVHHIAENFVTIDEAEELILRLDRSDIETSDESGLPLVRGYLASGRYLVVIFDFLDRDWVRVVTAFEPSES